MNRVVLLPAWQLSRGGVWEAYVAAANSIDVVEFDLTERSLEPLEIYAKITSARAKLAGLGVNATDLDVHDEIIRQTKDRRIEIEGWRFQGALDAVVLEATALAKNTTELADDIQAATAKARAVTLPPR